jgi:hypothetical protein
MKPSELTGEALNWAVAMSEGFQSVYTNGSILPVFRKCEAVENTIRCYSTEWAHGGPIIEREEISCVCYGQWIASLPVDGTGEALGYYGPTPLIAAMRCYVASKMGDTVVLPKELENV